MDYKTFTFCRSSTVNKTIRFQFIFCSFLPVITPTIVHVITVSTRYNIYYNARTSTVTSPVSVRRSFFGKFNPIFLVLTPTAKLRKNNVHTKISGNTISHLLHLLGHTPLPNLVHSGSYENGIGNEKSCLLFGNGGHCLKRNGQLVGGKGEREKRRRRRRRKRKGREEGKE